MMNLKNIKSVIIVFSLFITSSALCQEESKEQENFQKEANQYFEKTIDKLGIPGFAVVITQGNKTILAEGYGYADFENQSKANSNTNYYIASATKSFTALLAVLMNDSGIIKLDDPLRKYFPDLEINSDLDLNNIKVRDLLTHTSGLENDPISWRVAFSGTHNQATLLELMKYSKPNEAGYGNYEYTNTGYNIYAIILEKITGKSWQNWMQEKIFDPAGMNHTTAFISKAEKENWLLARPYIVIDSVSRIPLEKKDNTMQSAGGLIITPDDMATWLKLQVGKGKLNGKQIFPESIMISSQKELVNIPESKRLFKPTHYGMGWLHGSYKSKKVIHHFGGFAGFSTHVSFMPEEQIGIAVMVNEAITGNKLITLIAKYIYDYFLEKEGWNNYEEAMNSFAEKVNEGRKMIGASRANGNDRPWLLSMPNAKYSGLYESDEYGVFTIQESTTGIKVSIGNLECEATPYKNQDSIRVELIPGSGQVVQFVMENDKISGLQYDGIYFARVK